MSAVVLFNGGFVNAAEARLDVYDGGWLHGAGVFETMRAEYGHVWRLESHLGRLMRSAERLLSPVPIDALPGREQFSELLERNELTAGRVRLTVTAGSMLEAPGADGPRFTVAATVTPLTPYAPHLYQRGVRVKIAPYRQCTTDPLAGHKSTCYLPRLLALRDARRAGCEEALWFTEFNHLAEGSVTNVFLAKDGALRTPPLETPVLPGIARQAVLELAEAKGIEIVQKPTAISDLLDADEVFLTNVIMLVMPVTSVEQREIAGGRVGPLTQQLSAALNERVLTEVRKDG